MLIRTLTKDDAQALQECRLFGLKESPEAFLASYAEVAGMPLAHVESELEDSSIHYVGAFDGGQLVGFMRYVRPSRRARLHTAEVRSVYVRKVARGRRVGYSLLQQLIQDASLAGVESLHLSVLANNARSRELYESCGFRLYGTEPQAIKKDGLYVDQALYWLSVAAT